MATELVCNMPSFIRFTDLDGRHGVCQLQEVAYILPRKSRNNEQIEGSWIQTKTGERLECKESPQELLDVMRP